MPVRYAPAKTVSDPEPLNRRRRKSTYDVVTLSSFPISRRIASHSSIIIKKRSPVLALILYNTSIKSSSSSTLIWEKTSCMSLMTRS